MPLNTTRRRRRQQTQKKGQHIGPRHGFENKNKNGQEQISQLTANRQQSYDCMRGGGECEALRGLVAFHLNVFLSIIRAWKLPANTRQRRESGARSAPKGYRGGYSGLQRVMAGYGYGYGYVLVWFTQLALRAELYLWLWFGSVRLLPSLTVSTFDFRFCAKCLPTFFCKFVLFSFFLSIAFRSQIKYFHAGISFWDLRSDLLQNSCASNIQHMMEEFKRISDFTNRFWHFYRVCGESCIQPQALGQLTFWPRRQRLSKGCGQGKFNAAWFINVNDHIDLYVRHVWHGHMLLLPHVTNSHGVLP